MAHHFSRGKQMMPDSAPSTSLNLLAPDGIIHVTFSTVLNSDQYSAFLAATDAAKSYRELEDSLRALAGQWGIQVTTEVLSRKQPPPVED